MKAELAKERVVVTAKNKIAIGEQLRIELDHVTGHGHISRHDNCTSFLIKFAEADRFGNLVDFEEILRRRSDVEGFSVFRNFILFYSV